MESFAPTSARDSGHGRLADVRVDRSPLSIVLDVIARQSGVSIRCDAPITETVTASLRDIALEDG